MSHTTFRQCWIVGLSALAISASAQTAVQWQVTADSNWFSASNWSTASVPTNTKAAVSASGPAYLVSTSGASSNVNLASLDVSSSSAHVLFDFSSSYNLYLGSDISSWSAGEVEFRNSGGIYGNGPTNTVVNIGSGATVLFSTVANTRNLYNLTVANAGTIDVTSGALAIGNSNLTNQSGGVLNADGAEIDFNGSTTLSNGGTLEATGSSGILRFNATLSSGNLGNVTLTSGGHAYLAGTLNNATGLAKPNGGSYELVGGTINGGPTATGALIFTTSGGTLNGVSVADDLVLPTNGSVTLTGGTAFSGGNLTLDNSAHLHWQQSGSLAGKTITFGAGAGIDVSGANNTLTLANTTTASGDVQLTTDGSAGSAITNQGTITHSTGYGQIFAPSLLNSGNITVNGGATLTLGSYYNGYTTTNGASGNITADGSGSVLNIYGIINQGTLTASNSGQLSFQTGYGAAQTTANLGNIQIASGGHVYLAGTLDNTGATLTAPTGGKYELQSGTIDNGSIASGALTFTSGGGTLNNVTIFDNLSTPANTSVTLTGNTTFDSSVTTLTLGSNSHVNWQQVGTLAGKALSFGSGSYVTIAGTNNALTLGNTTTATGDVQITSDGSAGSAITNQGTITHTSGYGQLAAASLLNSGNITVNGGATLSLGSYYTGYVTTNAAGGNVTADGSGSVLNIYGIVNQGTLTASNSGQLSFQTGYGAAQTTANLGNIQIASGGHVYLAGTLDNTGATLTAPTGGKYELQSGTIDNGSIASGALTFTSGGGTLNNVTIFDNLSTPANTSVILTGNTTFDSSVTTLTLGSNSHINWQQAGTLAGKALSFGSGSYVYVVGTNNAVTLGNTTTATGDIQITSDGSAGSAITNQGTITHTTGYGQLAAASLLNSGNITVNGGATLTLGSYYTGNATTNAAAGNIAADGSGSVLNLYGIVNLGTLTASNSGQLAFQTGYGAAQTTANLGNIQIASGGHVYLAGTLDNTGATLTAPTGGKFELQGGTINNGSIASGALTFTGSGGTLNHVTIFDNVTTPANSAVTLTGNTTFDPSVTTLTLGNNSHVTSNQVGTLTGKTLSFGSGSYVSIVGTNNSLTLGNTTTVTGDVQITTDGSTGTAITNQGTITHTTGSGQLSAPTFLNSGNITVNGGATLSLGSYYTGYVTTNGVGGNVTADGSGSTLYIYGMVNQGTLTASNSGQLSFQTGYGNAQTTANLGNIQIASGGHVYLAGTLDNTSATLTAPTGGKYELQGGTINNGSIASGALTFTGSGGSLNHVTIFDNLTVPSSTGVTLAGNSNFDSTVSTLTLGSYAWIGWAQLGTLVNKSLVFGPSSYLEIHGANNALTLDSGSTATGSVEIFSDGSANALFVNQGNITHSTGTGYIGAYGVTNSGNITVSGGTLTLGSNSGNTTLTTLSGSAIHVTGGTLIFNRPTATPVVNNGLLDVQAGTVYTGPHLTNGSTGVVTGNGAVNGTFELAGGTISPGNNGIGTLTFATTSFAVTQPATFLVDVGGTSSDQLVFVNPTSTVNIGSGLLTLSLNLLSAPTANTTFNLISISSGGSGISGSFAGLPNSGGTLTANFGATPYTFAVNYQSNLITLAYNPVVVPEPPAVVLISFGLIAVGCVWRRRRCQTA
ncbi:MAG TPA: hypothetical protein VHE61_09300 [Opitutaceae bacterium]|nr:hypothetical protein [Opitutaceae bacterium]